MVKKVEEKVVEENESQDFEVDMELLFENLENKHNMKYKDCGDEFAFDKSYMESVCYDFGDYPLSILDLVRVGLKQKNETIEKEKALKSINNEHGSSLIKALTAYAEELKKEIYLSELVDELLEFESKKEVKEEKVEE